MEAREMYDEINALIGAVAKALDTSEMEIVTSIEQGRLSMEMLVDDEGRNYVHVVCDDKQARIYQGAIFREGDSADAEDKPKAEGHSGCSCGH